MFLLLMRDLGFGDQMVRMTGRLEQATIASDNHDFFRAKYRFAMFNSYMTDSLEK